MTDSTIILSTQNVSKYFYEPEKFKVLTDISFDIKRGEFVTMVGKSGSGKSTLLYLLSTMDTDYEGTLLFDEENLTKQKKNDLLKLEMKKLVLFFNFITYCPNLAASKT